MEKINNMHSHLTTIMSMYESEVMKHPNCLAYKTNFRNDFSLGCDMIVEVSWSRDNERTNFHTYNKIDSDIDLSIIGETIYTSTVNITKDAWKKCPKGYYVTCRNEIGKGNRLMVLPCDDFFDNIPEEIDYISLNNYGNVLIVATFEPQHDITIKLHLKNISEKRRG